MDKAEVKQTAKYLKGLEDGLDQQGRRGLADLGHVTKLHLIIKRLMDASLQTTNQKIVNLIEV